MVMPGEDATVTVTLISPIALEVCGFFLGCTNLRAVVLAHADGCDCRCVAQEGQRFTVRECNKTVGTGLVATILA
jgi:translation elongation factor EF-Tu-like GTPase